eukprot:CAMPEP_0119102650 /NCGR_PEP_ID=MMETSP1180-20130426/1324_1 /TAXON_ID=3052 ORGANISM="Chlamydomonas cf sp, Strain CCMP681" /NCGR_SAMPLE_ID=MMETSP1180 /ASSEMBLY_ACC=CAM_ASM_000741 /LENGTH=323 /DNA_ID=CAMNT_0007086971 /DNA_START=13 /DNA_END=984 /DNA_ORIENTATION=+
MQLPMLHGQALGQRCCGQMAGVHRVANFSAPRPQSKCKAVPEDSEAGKPLISEDVLARLLAAEAEAQRLRKQLAAAQAAKGAPTSVPDVMAAKPKRVDGQGDRETLFAKGGRASWLSEADVNFFVGDGVGETNVPVKDPEYESVVQRRLLIGGLLTLGAAAFALVPTEALRPKPSKPLYFYVVPLLRVKDLLTECPSIIENADWVQLRQVLTRVQGTPNDLLSNLENVANLLSDVGGAQSPQSRAQQLAREINEYIDSMDSIKKYYDSMPTRVITAAENAGFVSFSTQALKAAQQRLNQFLAIIPGDAMQAAVQQGKLYRIDS